MWRITFTIAGDIVAEGATTREEAIAFFKSEAGEEAVGRFLSGASPELTDVYEEED